jgi:acetyl-CoA carboxylase biotin carboxyl carrier protein
MSLSNDDVQDILRLLDGSFHDELHLETKSFKLALRRAGGAPGLWSQETTTFGTPNLLNPTGGETSLSPTPPGAGTVAPPRQSALAPGMTAIVPPLIGTFYRAPKPGAAPFVELGSTVTPDTVVGIIETMKLMNPVLAQTGGTITEIRAENGQLVEADHILMVVTKEPA